MPDDDEIFRFQIAQALAREPSRAELEVDLAARVWRWLRTPDDRLLLPEIQPFPLTDDLKALAHDPMRERSHAPHPAEDYDRHRAGLSTDAADVEGLGRTG